jgi:hypothetical protein
MTDAGKQRCFQPNPSSPKYAPFPPIIQKRSTWMEILIEKHIFKYGHSYFPILTAIIWGLELFELPSDSILINAEPDTSKWSPNILLKYRNCSFLQF